MLLQSVNLINTIQDMDQIRILVDAVTKLRERRNTMICLTACSNFAFPVKRVAQIEADFNYKCSIRYVPIVLHNQCEHSNYTLCSALFLMAFTIWLLQVSAICVTTLRQFTTQKQKIHKCIAPYIIPVVRTLRCEIFYVK